MTGPTTSASPAGSGPRTPGMPRLISPGGDR
jgi:hypothetical protein